MILKIIATLLNQYRTSHNWTFDSLSEKTGIDPTYLSRVEHGEINITVKTLDKLLSGLNVSASEFFRDADIILEDSYLELLFKEISSSDRKDEITQVLKGIVDLSK